MVDALLTGPVEGYPLRVVLPGLDRVLWWGPDANDQDVVAASGGPWHDRSRISDVCYDKLVAANLPWMFDRSSYSPRWTRRELQHLHGKLGEAITLITHALR